MVAHTRAKFGQLIKIDFVRFGMVGSVGFIVTSISKIFLFAGVLHLGIISSTFLGSEVGVLSNFIFHETWTYNSHDHKHKPLWKKFLHFQLSSLSGVLIFTVIGSIAEKGFGLPDLPSLAIAAGITMFWNFFWTKYFIFKGRTPAILLKPEDVVLEDEV